MKKIVAYLLTIALTAGVAVGGTMAYLTADADAKENVFTVGKIAISLDEEVEVIGQGGTVTSDNEGADYVEIMPGDYLKKEVTVSNDGKTDAYVAVTVKLNNADKINAAIDDVYENAPYNYSAEKVQAVYDEVFDGWGINYNPRPGITGKNDARGVIDGTYGLPENTLHVDFAKTTSSSTVIGAGNWFIAGNEKAGQYWVDNNRGEGKEDNGYYTKDMADYEICYTYYMMLPAGESSTLFKGLNVPAEFTSDQMKMFDDLVIEVNASAIQADNMGIAEKYKDDTNGKAKTAFEVLAGTIKAEDLNVNNNPSAPKGFQVSNDTELADAISNGETEIWLNPGTYHMPASAQGKTLIINGTKESVIEIAPAGQGEANGQLDYNLDGSTVAFNGITIKTNNQTYAGFARLTGTYNNCTFDGHYSLQRKSMFKDCTFNVSGDQYNLWTWGAPEATFEGCTFNSDGKAILVYNSNCDVYVNKCTFNDSTNGTGYTKSAIETGADYGPKTYNIYITDIKVNGFAENNVQVGYKNIVGNKNSLSKDYLNIVVDGVDVY